GPRSILVPRLAAPVRRRPDPRVGGPLRPVGLRPSALVSGDDLAGRLPVRAVLSRGDPGLLAGSELDSHAGARLVGDDDCRRLDYPVRGDGRTLRDSSSGRRARGERALASLPDRRDLAASARAAVRPLSEEASMSVETRNDLRALREAGSIVRAALDTMS